jgi:hypothetical protein
MVTDQTRRTLLKAALFGATVPLLPSGCVTTKTRTPALIGCSIIGRDKFAAVVADEHGMPISKFPIPARGHGVATSKQGHAVVFGRRPGTFFMVFDYRTEQVIKLQAVQADRHFYGHGVFSHDGNYLFATEGERSTSRGIIGIYDVQKQYQKIDELTGFGVGPHEVIMMPDGTLAIGVGGVHTKGREVLNLDTMTPSLSYLSQDGELLDKVSLPDFKLSIRHLAHDGTQTVLCGQQYRGEPDEYPALIAMHTRGGEIQDLQAEPEEWARFNHYVASIAATDDWILATSPPGSCYGIWSKKTRKLVELSALPDASGVVIYGGEFRVSSGAGNIVEQRPNKFKNTIASGVQWDNHWSRVVE